MKINVKTKNLPVSDDTGGKSLSERSTTETVCVFLNVLSDNVSHILVWDVTRSLFPYDDKRA